MPLFLFQLPRGCLNQKEPACPTSSRCMLQVQLQDFANAKKKSYSLVSFISPRLAIFDLFLGVYPIFRHPSDVDSSMPCLVSMSVISVAIARGGSTAGAGVGASSCPIDFWCPRNFETLDMLEPKDLKKCKF